MAIIKAKGNIEPVRTSKPHGKPVTRREFLGQGLIAGATVISVPTIASLLGAKSAYAQQACTMAGVVPISFGTIELAGGNGWSKAVMPHLRDGSPARPSNEGLGYQPSENPDTTIIRGLMLNRSDRFYTTLINTQFAGLDNTLLRRALSNLSGSVIHTKTRDDSGDNAMLPNKAILELTGGQIHRAMNFNGIRSRNIDGKKGFATVSINSVTSMVNATGFRGTNFNPITPDRRSYFEKIANGARSLASLQARELAGKAFSSELLDKLLCGLTQNLGRAEPGIGSRLLDPANQPLINRALGGVFDLPAAFAPARAVAPTQAQIAAAGGADSVGARNLARQFNRNDFIPRTARQNLIDLALFDAAARRQVGSFYIQRDGYDYHNNVDFVQVADEDNGATTAQLRHEAVARMIQLWVVAHYVNKTSGMLYLPTDGAISFRRNVNGLYEATGDNDNQAIQILLYYNHSDAGGAAIAMNPLGSMQVNGVRAAVDLRTLVGPSPQNASIAVVMNYANMAGIRAQAEAMFGGVLDSSSLNQLLVTPPRG
ncbi:MAG: hypothetical protein AB1540_05245 [Bdellovibrionota bacterium]